MFKEFGLPIGCTNVRAVKDEVEYTIDASHIHTRTGSSGSIPVFLLHTHEYAKGEILEGAWRKGWDTRISTFVCKLDTVNDKIQMSGTAAVAGSEGLGWAKRRTDRVILMDGATLIIKLQVPAAVTASRIVGARYYIVFQDPSASPSAQDDWLLIRMRNNNGTYQYNVRKSVNNTESDVIAWTALTNEDAAIKLEFAEEGDGHTHIYVDDGISGTYTEHGSSPFALDLAYKVGIPAIEFSTTDGTSRIAYVVSEEWTYPNFQIKWDDTDTDYTQGVKLYDGDPDSGGQLVLSQDHLFSNDIYLQNGFVRLIYTEGVDESPLYYAYVGGSYTQFMNRVHYSLDVSNISLVYTEVYKILKLSPDEVKLRIRAFDSSTHDENYFAIYDVSLKRGIYYALFELVQASPRQNIARILRTYPITSHGYSGDGKIGDYNLAKSGDNTTMSDNFILTFNPSGLAAIIFSAFSKRASVSAAYYRTYFAWFQSSDAVPYSDALGDIWIVGVVPFSLVANLFKEAESATISASARLYLDGAGEDTTTENSGKWAATLNCAVDENDAAMPPQVGAKNVMITSSGAGGVQTRCTPAAPLGNLLKFDYLKFWAQSPSGISGRYIYLIDADGDSIRHTFSAPATATQYSYEIPHNATELAALGWTETGTFNYATFSIIAFTWDAAGAGEILRIDGLHEYIGTTTTRGRGETLSGGSAVVLDAQNEANYLDKISGTNLPTGKYLAVWRVKDTDQIANDFSTIVVNSTDSSNRNENNTTTSFTLTSTFAYYIAVFDITDTDVIGTDNIRIRVVKGTASENTIFVDYFLVIPLGDGRDWPQDLAHAALLTADQRRRVFRK